MATSESYRSTEEEEDNLARSIKRSKDGFHSSSFVYTNPPAVEGDTIGRNGRISYRDKFKGSFEGASMEMDSSEEDRDVSDDDLTEDEGQSPWFKMGMIRKEKIESRWPWKTSLIIKLISKKIGYQYLLKHFQIMWRLKSPISLIDLPNDFFIVRFTTKDDYSTTLIQGSMANWGSLLAHIEMEA